MLWYVLNDNGLNVGASCLNPHTHTTHQQTMQYAERERERETVSSHRKTDGRRKAGRQEGGRADRQTY